MTAAIRLAALGSLLAATIGMAHATERARLGDGEVVTIFEAAMVQQVVQAVHGDPWRASWFDLAGGADCGGNPVVDAAVNHNDDPRIGQQARTHS